jgi:23S rRNA pseudouridine1911/1915/1917 synthase
VMKQPPRITSDNLRILYEDNHILAVEKPPGILSQSDISGDPDLLTLAKEYIKNKYKKPGEVYLGLVHRLDRQVSGVMIFARTSKAAARLSEDIRNHAMRKLYRAYVEGIPDPLKGELTDFMIKDEKRHIAVITGKNQSGAKEAKLMYEVTNAFSDRNQITDFYSSFKGNKADLTRLPEMISEITIDLITGRFHQIRAQFSERGHPLLGDVKYGSKYPSPDGFIALTAYQITFIHPTLKKEITLSIAK